MAFPEYMCKGSKGPAVNIILSFLSGWASTPTRRPDGGHGIVPDCLLGTVGCYWLERLRNAHGVPDERDLGPKTITYLKSCGFDFEVAVRSTGGMTVFVQPDGTEILWSPEAERVAHEMVLGSRKSG